MRAMARFSATAICLTDRVLNKIACVGCDAGDFRYHIEDQQLKNSYGTESNYVSQESM